MARRGAATVGQRLAAQRFAGLGRAPAPSSMQEGPGAGAPAKLGSTQRGQRTAYSLSAGWVGPVPPAEGRAWTAVHRQLPHACLGTRPRWRSCLPRARPWHRQARHCGSRTACGGLPHPQPPGTASAAAGWLGGGRPALTDGPQGGVVHPLLAGCVPARAGHLAGGIQPQAKCVADEGARCQLAIIQGLGFLQVHKVGGVGGCRGPKPVSPQRQGWCMHRRSSVPAPRCRGTRALLQGGQGRAAAVSGVGSAGTAVLGGHPAVKAACNHGSPWDPPCW